MMLEGEARIIKGIELELCRQRNIEWKTGNMCVGKDSERETSIHFQVCKGPNHDG